MKNIKNIKQLRAIYYTARAQKIKKFNQFVEDNKIDLKKLGISKYKYLEVQCKKLRQLGYKINF